MSTETNGVLSEGLSEAELAYFSSKGEKTEGLADSEPAPSEPVQAETPLEPAEPANPDPTDDGVDADDPDAIYLDENGKARSVLTGKFVPHAALHKERERRKSTEQELMTYREKMARAEERLAVLNEVITAADKPAQPQGVTEPDTPPDPETDIFAYVKWQADKIKAMEAAQNQERQQTQQRQTVEQVQNLYKQDAMQFVQKEPNFAPAYQHLSQQRSRELKALGYSDAEIPQVMLAEEQSIVVQALQRQRSPAQVMYEMALARGFTPAQAQAQAAQPQNGAQKLQTIEKAKQTQRSLSGAGGSSGEGLTVEALANMSDEEFASVASKLGKSKMRGFLGG